MACQSDGTSVCHCLRTHVIAVASILRADDSQLEFFETKIRPVLVTSCYECHSSDAEELQGELRLDTRAAIRQGGPSGPVAVGTLSAAHRCGQSEAPTSEARVSAVASSLTAAR